MDLSTLGYTEKWIRYGLLTEEILNDQLSKFQKGEDSNTEHYRYGVFLNWLRSKKNFTDLEIKNFIEVALDDPDFTMAGSAVKELFTASHISDHQFNFIKVNLGKFGNWTTKLIQREELKKRVLNEVLTDELIKKCLEHRTEFNENTLIELIICKTEKVEILAEFTQNNFGKRIRNLASQKIKRINKPISNKQNQ